MGTTSSSIIETFHYLSTLPYSNEPIDTSMLDRKVNRWFRRLKRSNLSKKVLKHLFVEGFTSTELKSWFNCVLNKTVNSTNVVIYHKLLEVIQSRVNNIHYVPSLPILYQFYRDSLLNDQRDRIGASKLVKHLSVIISCVLISTSEEDAVLNEAMKVSEDFQTSYIDRYYIKSIPKKSDKLVKSTLVTSTGGIDESGIKLNSGIYRLVKRDDGTYRTHYYIPTSDTVKPFVYNDRKIVYFDPNDIDNNTKVNSDSYVQLKNWRDGNPNIHQEDNSDNWYYFTHDIFVIGSGIDQNLSYFVGLNSKKPIEDIPSTIKTYYSYGTKTDQILIFNNPGGYTLESDNIIVYNSEGRLPANIPVGMTLTYYANISEINSRGINELFILQLKNAMPFIALGAFGYIFYKNETREALDEAYNIVKLSKYLWNESPLDNYYS